MPERVTEGEGYKRQLSLTAIGGLADESNDNQVESGEYIVQRYTRAGEALVKISEVAITNVQGTHDSAAPTQVVMQGQFAETTVPTAVADGDVVRPWVDEYGRPIGKTDDLSSGSTLVTQTDSPRVAYIGPFTNAQIDEPGVTTAVGIEGCPHWAFVIVVGGTPLASTIEAEGTNNDTDYCTLTPETTAKAGLAIANCVGTISAAGNYEWKGTTAVSKIRLKVMGDSGSPDSATFDITLSASA